MDDAEYYSMMRKHYSHIPERFGNKKPKPKSDANALNNWKTRQGKDDEEMLDEKNSRLKDKSPDFS